MYGCFSFFGNIAGVWRQFERQNGDRIEIEVHCRGIPIHQVLPSFRLRTLSTYKFKALTGEVALSAFVAQK